LFRTIGIGLEWWNDRIVEWWGISPVGRLGLFVQTVLPAVLRRLGVPARLLSSSRRKDPDSRRDQGKLGLFRTIGRSQRPASLEIGFVLHNSPCGSLADRRNWVFFAHFALRRPGTAGRRAGVPPQVCSQSTIEKLGSFCTFRSPGLWPTGEIGFVSPDQPRGRPSGSKLALFRTSHLTPQTSPQLGLFRTIGIGLEWWNDRIVEWWGISPAERLGLFRTIGPALVVTP
jgi:hypothetical protein